jgi:LPS export ABC transporter protein LptC
MTSTRLTFVLLTLIAAWTWWLNRSADGEPQPVADVQPRKGYFMSEAEVTSAGADGRPRYRLTADEIRQGELGGPVSLQQVRVLYNVYSPDQWEMTAPDGELSADQQLLELWGGVELLGHTQRGGDTRVETERLLVDTARNTASTDAEVFLDFGAQKVRATGMVAYLMEERVELQSSVHGRFQP